MNAATPVTWVRYLAFRRCPHNQPLASRGADTGCRTPLYRAAETMRSHGREAVQKQGATRSQRVSSRRDRLQQAAMPKERKELRYAIHR
jgi:hypothetical protein